MPICSSDTYHAVNEFCDTWIQQTKKIYAKNDFLKFSNFQKRLEIAQRRPFVFPIHSKHGERVLLCSTIMGERHNANALSVVLCFWTDDQMNGMCEEFVCTKKRKIIRLHDWSVIYSSELCEEFAHTLKDFKNVTLCFSVCYLC